MFTIRLTVIFKMLQISQIHMEGIEVRYSCESDYIIQTQINTRQVIIEVLDAADHTDNVHHMYVCVMCVRVCVGTLV